MHPMKPILLFISLLFLAPLAWSQKSGQTDFELGLNGGVSWYNGDLNTLGFFSKRYMHQAYGISLRRNLNQRFALRFQLNHGKLSADDALAKNTFQRNRNLNFTSTLYELASTIEFNFLPFDALINDERFSPYSFIGISGFYFNPTTSVEGSIYELHPLQTEGAGYSRFSIAIPFGMGIKLALSDRLLLSTEWGLRRTFSDYIDDVSGTYPLEGELHGLAEDLADRSTVQTGPNGSNWGTQRGDATNNDWYSFAIATLSVRLGPKKGSCKHLRI
jgi:hypothetical protein